MESLERNNKNEEKPEKYDLWEMLEELGFIT